MLCLASQTVEAQRKTEGPFSGMRPDCGDLMLPVVRPRGFASGPARRAVSGKAGWPMRWEPIRLPGELVSSSLIEEGVLSDVVPKRYAIFQ